jgi:hypothetical protein
MFVQKEVPLETEIRKARLFWVVLGINVIFILGYDVTVFVDNEIAFKTGADISLAGLIEYIALKYSVGVLQFVSGVFLIVAIIMIRRFLVANGLGEAVNDASMFLHGISYTLYLMSILFFYYYYYVFLISIQPDTSNP